MAKNFKLAKKVKTHGKHKERALIKSKWVNIKNMLNGPADGIDLKSILIERSLNNGIIVPLKKEKALFSICYEESHSVMEDYDYDKLAEVIQVKPKSTEWLKELWGSQYEDVVINGNWPQNFNDKPINISEEANTTFTFSEDPKCKDGRSKRCILKMRNLMIKLCERFDELYEKNKKKFDPKESRDHLEKRMKWRYFVKYAEKKDFEGIEKSSRFYETIRRSFYLELPQVIDSVIDKKYIGFYSWEKFYEDVVEPRIREEEDMKRKVASKKRPLIHK